MAWRKPSNVNEWKSIFVRHQRVFFFPAIAVMILVMLVSFKLPREYRAEAKFERKSDLAMDTAGTAILKSNLVPLRRKMYEDLKGRSAIEQLVEDLGLTRDLRHNPDGTLTYQGQQARADLVSYYQSRLGVRWQTQSDPIDVVAVTFTAAERDMAPKVVNKLVENYLRRTRNELDAALLNAKQFFDSQVDFYKARSQELETLHVRQQINTPGLSPGDPISVQNRLVEVRAQLQRVSQELDVRKAERAQKEELVESMPDEIVKRQSIPNPMLQDLIRRRGDLERQLDDLISGGRTEEHPTVKKTRAMMRELDGRIMATQQLVDGSSTTEPNTGKVQLKNEIKTMSGTIQALTEQRDDLTQQVDKVDFMMRNIEVKRAEFMKLQRDLDEAHEQLKFWEGKLNSTMIALKAELGSRGVHLTFAQRADVARPSKPQLLLVSGAALGLGLAVGLLLVFLAELTDGSFRNVDQAIDELKLPVLGAVTQIMSPAEVMRRKVMSWAVLPSIGGAMVLVLVISYWCARLSLEDTPKFERLMSNPPKFVFESLTGKGS